LFGVLVNNIQLQRACQLRKAYFATVQGCLEKMEDKVVRYAPILIGLGLAVAMIQVDFLFHIVG